MTISARNRFHVTHQPGDNVDSLQNRLRPGVCGALGWALLLCLVTCAGVTYAGGGLSLSAPGAHEAYVAELAAQSQARKAEAVVWAQQRGLPIRYEDEYHIRELMAVWDDRPLYYETQNVQAAISIGADRIRDLAPWNLDGEGFIVGVWDGSVVFADHPEFQGPGGGSRVAVHEAGEISEHATHVTGTIAATGLDPAARGMAPRALIKSHNWSDDLSQMAFWAAREPGQSDKIYVSNHSYGFMAGWEYFQFEDEPEYDGWYWMTRWKGRLSYDDWFGQYNEISGGWDYVAGSHPYYLAFTAAGNDRNDNPQPGDKVFYWSGTQWSSETFSPDTCPLGDGEMWGGYRTISGAAVAKNVMTVGAVDDAVLDAARGLSKAAMSDFSGWGPANDGRIKPDIVTNGIGVYSTIYDPNDANNLYDSHDGTSMACPTATGSAVLLVQYYDRLFPGQSMRASTLKGLILHTADDLGRTGPDYQFGWGLMNATAAAELIQDHHDCDAGDLMIEGLLSEENPDDTYYAHVTDNAPIRVTLCWTVRSSRDLDIRTAGPGGSSVYHPWVLDPADPCAPAGTGDNRRDNVEQVYIGNPPEPGIYEIRISCKASMEGQEQHYSLISSLPLWLEQQPVQSGSPPVTEDMQVYVDLNRTLMIPLTATDDGLPNPPGRLTYAIGSLPNHGTLEYTDGTPIAELTVLADDSSHVVYRPDSDFTGSDSFTFCADDGGNAPYGGSSNSARVSIEVGEFLRLELQVGATYDDAYTTTSTASRRPRHSESGDVLKVGRWDYERYDSGMRLRNVAIPRGSTIVGAHLKILTARSLQEGYFEGIIQAEAVGNALGFEGEAREIPRLARSETSSLWIRRSGDWPSNLWCTSPNIGPVIQEIIDRPDWSPGNAIAIIFSSTQDTLRAYTSFYSFDSDPEQGAKLEIILLASTGTDEEVTPASPGVKLAAQNEPAAAAGTAPRAKDMMVCVRPTWTVTFELSATDDGLPDPPGRLSYTVASLPQHGRLLNHGVTLTEPTTLADFENELLYWPDNDFSGRDSFTFYADDGGSAPTGGVSNTATVELMVMRTKTCELEIQATADDAYVGNSGQNQITNGSPLLVGMHTSAMRFAQVDVPPQSEILNARLQINLQTTAMDHTIDGVLHGEATGNAANFLAEDRNILDLPRTQAAVPWTWPVGDYGPTRTYFESPNLAQIVQEIVDRPDWVQGNALALVYSSRVYNGQELEFLAYESIGHYGPKLEITYATHSDREPVVVAPADQNAPVAHKTMVSTLSTVPVTVPLSASDDGLPDPPAALRYAILSLPQHGTITTLDGGSLDLLQLLPAGSNEVLYRPGLTFIGRDSFSFHALDGIESLSGRMSNPARVTVEVRSMVTREFQVIVDEDDAYASDSEQTVLSEFLNVGQHSSAMRFRNVDLPPGSDIISAYLKMSAGSESVEVPLSTAVQAEATTHPADFTEENPHLYDRLVTEAFVPWPWEPGVLQPRAWYSSPDIGEVLQEIIDREDWLPGNPIAILHSGETQNSADVQFYACAHPNFDRAAKLQITFDPNRDWEPPEEPNEIPPTAEEIEVATAFNTPVTIALAATDDGLPDPPGRLTYAIVSLPDNGTLEHPDGTAIAEPCALSAHNNEVVYWPDPDFTGLDSFTFSADDGGAAPYGGPSDPAAVTVVVRPSATHTATVEYQVNRSSNDADAKPGGVFNSIFEDYLYVGRRTSAMRFENVEVPPNSQILSARLKICVYKRTFENRLDAAIYAESIGDAPDFWDVNPHICDRARTDTAVPWNWTPEEFLSQDWKSYSNPKSPMYPYTWAECSSPDISPVVQEVIDHRDWRQGNAIVIIYGPGDDYYGQDLRFVSVDHAYHAEEAPELEITYGY